MRLSINRFDGRQAELTLTDRKDVEALYDLLELALCRWPDAEAAEV